MLLTDLGRRRQSGDCVRYTGHAPHRHDRPHLVYLALGSALLDAGRHSFSLTEGVGAWLPSDCEHALELSPGGIAMGPLLSPAAEPPGGIARVVDDSRVRSVMTTLLSVRPAPGADALAFRTELGRALLPLREQYFPIRLPVHPQVRAIARDALRSPAPLDELAARRYISARQAQRAFLAETGLPFGRWRTLARLNKAIVCLRDGQSMAAAVSVSGFTTREGLIRALRRECPDSASLVESRR